MMRKLIMWNLITLDGFFEGTKKWDLEFHNDVWSEDLERFALDQLKTVGTLLFGRVTYEGMAAYWTTVTGEAEVAKFMNALPKIVASTTLKKAEWNNSRIIGDDVVGEITKLKQQPGKDIFVFGSADLSATLMQHGLFDEYRIGLAPVILGSGTPLFTAPQKSALELVDRQSMQKGFVVLRYIPKKK